MNRSQVLWLECWIAISGGVFWALPPTLPYARAALLISLAWAVLAGVSIWVENLENWSHRMSAFIGFLFFTIEGILGLLGATEKSGMLLLAFLHGCAFVLSVVGKYMSRSQRRPRRSLEELTHAALEEARRQDGA